MLLMKCCAFNCCLPHRNLLLRTLFSLRKERWALSSASSTR